MKIILPIIIHGLIVLAKVIHGGAAAGEPLDDGRGLRGLAAAKCLGAGKKCKPKVKCCSGKCSNGVCAAKAPTAPAKPPTSTQCSVPDQGQCNGAGYKGCKTCAKGSGCVYSTKQLSVCLPGYGAVADKCVVADGAQCGGQGYSGCQICKAGSQCVEMSPLSSICYAGGKVPDETAPMIDDTDLMDVGNWVKGIDPKLDADLDTMRRRHLQGANSTNATSVDYDEVRQRISKAFATEDGLQKAQDLMRSNTAFQKFNNNSAAELQVTFCTTIQSSTSLVSAEVKDCVCGSTDKPFVYCAALLEQELNQHMESRRNRKDRRHLSRVSRNLPSCAITFEGVGKKDKFMKYASALSNQVSDMTPASSEEGAGDFCAGGECSVPLAPLPLDAVFGVEACAPTLGILKDDVSQITDLDVRRAAAGKTTASIFAKICLSGSEELQEATSVLEFIGLDLCPIQFKGTIRPFMGVLEGEVTAAVLMLYVTGNVMLQYETETRNSLRLCDGAQCSNGENEDCAMCSGEMYATVEFGVKFLFVNFKKTLAQTDVIEKCTSTDSSTGQCSSGLGESDKTKWDDGKICGLGTTCNQCANPATYWESLAFTACGSEPCWADGTVCGAGTTCKK
jgi:Fungal cellulose binding domain